MTRAIVLAGVVAIIAFAQFRFAYSQERDVNVIAKRLDSIGVQAILRNGDLKAVYAAGLRNFDDVELVILSSQATLRVLEIGNTRATDIGVARLHKLRSLEEFGASDLQLADRVVEPLLQNNPGLSRLCLDGTAISDGCMEVIATLPMLDHLNVCDTTITDAGVAKLANHAAIQSLWLAGTCITDGSLKSIGTLPRLQELFLNRTAITDAGVAQLRACPRLRELQLGRTNITDDVVEVLRTFPELESVSLVGTRITDRGVAGFATCKKLKHLTLWSTSVSEAAILKLERDAPNLKIYRRGPAEAFRELLPN